jgi:hypothetical protein
MTNHPNRNGRPVSGMRIERRSAQARGRILMMMAAWRILPVCMGLGLLTFGCANLPVKPSAETLEAASKSTQLAGTQFDGVFQGAIKIISAGPEIPRNWRQPVGNGMILRVTNGSIHYALAYANLGQTQTFSIPVASDGLFSGSGSMSTTMSGHVTGNQINGTIVGQGCSWAFSAQRS